MERRGWIVALGALLLVGAGIWVWWAGQGESHGSGRTPVFSPEGGGGGGGGDVTAGEPGGPSASGDGRRRALADGGVPSVARHVDPPPGQAPTENANGVRASRGIPRDDSDADQTAGWRLGQARRRIEILESREETYQAAVDRFVEEGREDTAARQRARLERVQERLNEMRELETELAAEAEADGTMGDVETGFEEGEAPPRPAGGTTVGTR